MLIQERLYDIGRMTLADWATAWDADVPESFEWVRTEAFDASVAPNVGAAWFRKSDISEVSELPTAAWFQSANGRYFINAEEQPTVLMFGARADAGADAADSLTAMFDVAGGRNVRIPDGTYSLGSAYTVPAADHLRVSIDGGATFPGQYINFYPNIIPYQVPPVFGREIIKGTYAAADWNDYTNIFQVASAVLNDNCTAATVAVFGQGEADGSAAAAWGGNFVAYARDTGRAISVEMNYGALGVTGGDAYGLVLAAAGDHPTKNAIQIQSNNSNAPNTDGIRFNNASRTSVTQKLIASQSGSHTHGILFDSDFSSAEWQSRNFIVGPTVTSYDSGLRVDASASGLPRLSAFGTATNARVVIRGKGSAGVELQDGASGSKLHVNTTGFGVFGATPVARGALAAPTGSITRTTFDTTTVTTAQLAERVYAIINDLRAFGFFS